METKESTLQTTIEKLIEELSRTTDQIFSHEELKQKLNSGKQLRIKFGADVTAPFLHLGHGVNLRMMRKFQDHGHKVIFLIGDFTTRIGDPSGRNACRPVLSEEQIAHNASCFLSQVAKVLITDDPHVFECKRNSEWYDTMALKDFLALCSRLTHTRLLSRDMFKSRIVMHEDIFIHEILYPILQGWDSVVLQSDLTIVGSDQLFNEMMGRFYQEKEGQEPQVVMTSTITPGLDGVHKQSKSLNNYIAIEDSPRDKFGKVMSLPDHLIGPWLRVYSDLELLRIDALLNRIALGENPRNVKLELAESIVRVWHGAEIARAEHAWFLETISGRKFPGDAPLFAIPSGHYGVFDLMELVEPNRSKAAKRILIYQGAVRLDTRVICESGTSVEIALGQVYELSIGKRGRYRLVALTPHEAKECENVGSEQG